MQICQDVSIKQQIHLNTCMLAYGMVNTSLSLKDFNKNVLLMVSN